ncbi:hypothetical protein RRG08_037639 [Elysia crispata]|uniref:Uncharacterized protein n=1 Tax=Elysia crispata TaxID=231223 RepID=A0AAE1CYJ0_9GAST|nr:hypothetical protein RRG08_037639 [Elysia crispata]
MSIRRLSSVRNPSLGRDCEPSHDLLCCVDIAYRTFIPPVFAGREPKLRKGLPGSLLLTKRDSKFEICHGLDLLDSLGVINIKEGCHHVVSSPGRDMCRSQFPPPAGLDKKTTQPAAAEPDDFPSSPGASIHIKLLIARSQSGVNVSDNVASKCQCSANTLSRVLWKPRKIVLVENIQTVGFLGKQGQSDKHCHDDRATACLLAESMEMCLLVLKHCPHGQQGTRRTRPIFVACLPFTHAKLSWSPVRLFVPSCQWAEKVADEENIFTQTFLGRLSSLEDVTVGGANMAAVDIDY